MTTSQITLNARAKHVANVIASVGATRDAATSYAAYVRAQGLTLDMCKADKTLVGRHARAVLALHEDYAGKPVPPTTRLANAADRKRYAKLGRACPKRVPTAYGADVSRMVEGFKRAIQAQSPDPDAPKRAKPGAAEVFGKACIAAHKSAEVSLSDALASLMGAYGADAGKLADILAEVRAESASE